MARQRKLLTLLGLVAGNALLRQTVFVPASRPAAVSAAAMLSRSPAFADEIGNAAEPLGEASRINLEETCKVVKQQYFKDNWGSYNMTFWEGGRCDLELKGFGTTELVKRMCDDADEAVAEYGRDVACVAFTDMQRAIGSSPLAISRATRFLRETGPRWKRACIVAPGPIAAICDFALKIARIQGVRFFSDADTAKTWFLS
eukprot:TRINITY_DN103856_c0_g1_i1.p1 TRINITY_DN103856_c0_g1~~TRINITY_DN103856_c0_g1_i1.p1  ORF type:complete len:201 (-),score=27.77 TRINITY_DN103856_c0_g1_i1:209-811(-)